MGAPIWTSGGYGVREKRKAAAVAAGQTLTKKQRNPVTDNILYLNYGLLGLVTMLRERAGLDVRMWQGNLEEPEDVLARIAAQGYGPEGCGEILLSVPSFYHVPWAAAFCRLAKEAGYGRILLGGRWAVDPDPEWIRWKIPHADEILCGFGERRLLAWYGADAMAVPDGDAACFPHFDYMLLDGWQEYRPYIEVSRGCGAGCSFCMDGRNRRLANKAPEAVMAELDRFGLLYGDCAAYFQAPHFCFEKEWTEAYHRLAMERGRIVPWRCTTRVESVPEDMLGMLSEAGLGCLDLGLESASCAQLLKMRKTRDPGRYLGKAESVLEACARYGIWVKLNILLYAGETQGTLAETEGWLRAHAGLVKGISAGCVTWYKGMGDIGGLVRDGARVPDASAAERDGYADLDPSEEISRAEGEEKCLRLSRAVMSARDYYDLKAMTYFRRGYTWEEFLADAGKAGQERLPFRL